MKARFGILAIVLWLVTVGVFAVFFVKGSTSKGTDNRRAIGLSAQEKDLVLGEMRTLLKALNTILAALSENNLPKAAEAASTAGMAMAVDVNPILMAKLPLDFKELGMGTHKAFDQIATDIKSGATTPMVLKSLRDVTGKCIACHEINRFP